MKKFIFYFLVIFLTACSVASDLYHLTDESYRGISSKFGDIKRNGSGVDLIQIEKYLTNTSAYSDSKDNIQIIKAHSADILLQAYRNGDYGDSEVIDLAVSELVQLLDESSKLETTQIVISALGLVDSNEIFNLIINKLNDGEIRLATISALSLSSMCKSYDGQLLEQSLYRYYEDDFAERVLIQARQRREMLINKSTWCDQRQIPF